MSPDPAGRSLVHPTREDRIAAAVSEVVGGPAGRRIGQGRHGWWTATRVLVVLSMVLLAVGVVQKQHCRAQGWVSPDQFFHACYSDLPADYEGSGLASGVQPYLGAVQGQFLTEPVLTGTVMYALSAMVPAGEPLTQDRWFFDLSVVMIALALAATIALTAAMAGRRRWDAAHVALSPLLMLSALISLDLIGVALLVTALWAWSRRYPVVTGAMLGLAGAVIPVPAIMVWLALSVLALRAGQTRTSSRVAWSAVGVWTAVNLPVMLASAPGWSAGARAWWSQGPGYGSPWLLVSSVTQLSATAVTVLALAAMALVAVTASLLVLSAQTRPRVAQVALLLVAGGLLFNKSYPVQASVVLLPLVALAIPRWRDHLMWAGAEAAYFVGIWLYIAGFQEEDRGLPEWLYLTLLAVRLLAVVWLCVQVVRDIRRPERDPIRAVDGPEPVDDPGGGVVDQAPDAVLVSVR